MLQAYLLSTIQDLQNHGHINQLAKHKWKKLEKLESKQDKNGRQHKCKMQHVEFFTTYVNVSSSFPFFVLVIPKSLIS